MSEELKRAAEQNKILEVRGGSHLYGTNTPSSDEDFIGIFMPPKEYVLGLKSVKEVDFSIIDKDSSGKNTADAIDKKLYEFRKFISLALGSNPNIVELLFVPEKSIVYQNNRGRRLLNLRNSFLSQMCVPKFLGYAKSQKHKMIIKLDRFTELQEGLEYLSEFENKQTMSQVDDRSKELKDPLFYRKSAGTHIHCGDICFEPGVYVKKARRMMKERISKATNRTELVLKHGFDTKFASHLIRLLYEGLMLLEYRELVFPLPMADLLLDIKSGKWELGRVIEFAEELEGKIASAAEKTKLPKTPDFNTVEAFTVGEMQAFLLARQETYGTH